jgi:enamine deaminase RidA (YjgF/YER057c/UK114 family)
MTDIRRFQSNPRLSGAVAHGDRVYLSGQVAIDAGGGSVTDQVAEILDRIDALLAEAGTDKSRILSVNIYLTDVTTLPELNALWDRWVAPGCAPCRTTIETRLASPRYAVEISAVAAL